MDAFLALEVGRAVGAERDGLAGAHADAGFFLAGDAALTIQKHDVIGIAGYGLHLAAHQQRILVRNEKTAVERDLRPAARRHERVVQRAAGVEGERGGVAQREAGFAIGTDGANLARRGRSAVPERETATGKTGERHAGHAAYEAALKSVACVAGLACAAFDRTCAAAFFIGLG